MDAHQIVEAALRGTTPAATANTDAGTDGGTGTGPQLMVANRWEAAQWCHRYDSARTCAARWRGSTRSTAQPQTRAARGVRWADHRRCVVCPAGTADPRGNRRDDRTNGTAAR